MYFPICSMDRADVSGVLVEFLTWPIIRYKREVLFGWVDLLVSFGGIASLFLGFSLLSGVEIIYYFTLRACCMVYKNRVRVDPQIGCMPGSLPLSLSLPFSLSLFLNSKSFMKSRNEFVTSHRLPSICNLSSDRTPVRVQQIPASLARLCCSCNRQTGRKTRIWDIWHGSARAKRLVSLAHIRLGLHSVWSHRRLQGYLNYSRSLYRTPKVLPQPSFDRSKDKWQYDNGQYLPWTQERPTRQPPHEWPLDKR